jgi:hypothetical protein
MTANAPNPGLVEAEIDNMGVLFCAEENPLKDGSLNISPPLQVCPGKESNNYPTDISIPAHAKYK